MTGAKPKTLRLKEEMCPTMTSTRSPKLLAPGDAVVRWTLRAMNIKHGDQVKTRVMGG